MSPQTEEKRMKSQEAYIQIARKIDDQDPHTAPKDETGKISAAFIDYLKLVYTPEEAEIVKHLGLLEKPSTIQELMELSGRSAEYVETVLEGAHARNTVIGIMGVYAIPPIPLLVNIHQFYEDVRPGDVEAAKIYQDFFIKDKFYRYYEASRKGTPMARIIPVKRSIEAEEKILDAEEAHDYILNHSSDQLVMVPCPCRTRTEKLGVRECSNKFPIGACIMMGPAAIHFEMIGLGKKVTREQAVRYFDEMVELGLIGQTFNARKGDMVICLCCGCCCSQVRGRTQWDNYDALSPSNFIARPGDECLGCGACTERCLMGAISLDDDTGKAQVDAEKCIGCGVCTFACPQETLKLHRFERSTMVETPEVLLDKVFGENRED